MNRMEKTMNRLKLKAGWLILLVLLIFGGAPAAQAAAYSGGDGSIGDPYQIATAADLITLSRTSGDWSGYFIQTADIEFDVDHTAVDWNGDGTVDSLDDSGFTSIGNVSVQFTGSYDGGGHTISNLYINDSQQRYVGMFGYARFNGSSRTLKNISLIDVSVSSFCSYICNVGGLAGWIVGANGGGITTNNSVTGRVYHSCTGTSTWIHTSNIGGLVGQADYADIVNSHAACSVYSSSTKYAYSTGGIVGDTTGGITKCYATGSVYSHSAKAIFAGGIAGTTYDSITNSYATGSVFSYSTNGSYAGGLVGESLGGEEIKNCYATGSVYSYYSSDKSWAGGLAGYSNGNIKNSYATGSVYSSAGSSFAGGLAGESTGTNIRSFFDTLTTGMTVWAGNQASTSGALATSQFYSSDGNFSTNFGWNFVNIWMDRSDDYPILQILFSTSAPGVRTVAATDIDTTTATAIGYITDLGYPNPTAYGFCWSTGTDPTIDSCDGIRRTEQAVTATGSFSSNISGLSENTTYYIRAFATNDAGTGYGSSISFTTLTTDSGNSGDTDDPDPDEQLENAIDDALNTIEQSGKVVESVLEALDLALGLIASGDIDPDDALDALPLAARVLAYLETLTASGYEADAETVLAILANANEIVTAALTAHQDGQKLTNYELTLILKQSRAILESLGSLVETMDFEDRLLVLDPVKTLLVSGITAGLAANKVDTNSLSGLVDTLSVLVSACLSGSNVQECAELISWAGTAIREAVEAALAADDGSGMGRDLAEEIENEVRFICDAVNEFLLQAAPDGSVTKSVNQTLDTGIAVAMDSEKLDKAMTLPDIKELTLDIAGMLSVFTENGLTLSQRLVNSVVDLLDQLYEAGIDPQAEELGVDTSQRSIAGDKQALVSTLADAPGLLGRLLESFAAQVSCSLDREDLIQTLETVYTARQAAALEETFPDLVDFNRALLTQDSQTVMDAVTRALSILYPDDVVTVTGNLQTTLVVSLTGEDGSTRDIQTIMISDVRLAPSVIPDGVYALEDDGRCLLVAAPLAVTISSVFFDTCDAVLAIQDYGYDVAMETDGRFSIVFDEATTLCAMTGYGLEKASDKSGSHISFTAQVDDPTSGTYKITIHYPDGTTQDMVPAVLDLDTLTACLTGSNSSFSIDRNNGIFTLGDGSTYRPGFWITALTEDDLAYFTEHQVSGAAFRAWGNHIEFITAKGKQVFYLLEE